MREQIRVIDGRWERSADEGVTWSGIKWVPIAEVDMSIPVEEASMADYGTPSMVGAEEYGADGITVTKARENLQAGDPVYGSVPLTSEERNELMQIHHLLDRAGIGIGGNALERVALALVQRDNFAQGKTEKGTTTQHDMPEDIWTREQEIQSRVAEITQWWYDHAATVIERTAPKAAEYGAADLDLMGKNMEVVFSTQLRGTDRDFAEQFGRYAACAFYLQGKIARIFGALERGELPNPDSEFDIEVYAVMLDRIREFGRWV